MAFTAVVSYGNAFYKTSFLYAGVFYGILEFHEAGGMYSAGADVCGDSCGIWIFKVFFSWKICAVSFLCYFNANAVLRFDAAVVSCIKGYASDEYPLEYYSSGSFFHLSRVHHVSGVCGNSKGVV